MKNQHKFQFRCEHFAKEFSVHVSIYLLYLTCSTHSISADPMYEEAVEEVSISSFFMFSSHLQFRQSSDPATPALPPITTISSTRTSSFQFWLDRKTSSLFTVHFLSAAPFLLLLFVEHLFGPQFAINHPQNIVCNSIFLHFFLIAFRYLRFLLFLNSFKSIIIL